MSSSVAGARRPGFFFRLFPTFAAALSSLGWPLLRRQLLADFRKHRFFVSHLLSLGALAVALVVLMTVKVGEENLTPTRVGRELFSLFFIVQCLIVWVIFPAFSATAFSEERSNASLDLLLTTTMSPVELVWGKFLAATIYCLMYIIGSIPILAVAFLFGGVPPHEVLAAYVILIALTLLISMVGVCISSCCRSNMQATLWTYAVAFIGLGLFLSYFSADALWSEDQATTTVGVILNALQRGSDTFPLRVLGWILSFVVSFAYLFLLTANRLRSSTENKSSALRVLTFLVVPGVLALKASVLWSARDGVRQVDAATWGDWTFLCAFLLFVVAWIFPTEDARVSRRNRRQTRKLRGLYYPLRIFSPGAFWGLLYAVTLSTLVCGGALVWWRMGPGILAETWVAHRFQESLLTLEFCLLGLAAYGFFLASCDFSPRYSRATTLFSTIIVILLPLIFYLQETADALWTFYYLSPVTLWDSLDPQRVRAETVPLSLFGVPVVHMAKIVYAALTMIFVALGVFQSSRARYPMLRSGEARR